MGAIPSGGLGGYGITPPDRFLKMLSLNTVLSKVLKKIRGIYSQVFVHNGEKINTFDLFCIYRIKYK